MPFVLEWEGTKFEDDPDDPGGATKFGIDQRSHPDVDIAKLTEKEAFAIYWKEWISSGCQNLPTPLAQVYFDTAVNCGLGRAVRWMEAARMPRGKSVQQICADILTARDGHYYSLSVAHKQFAKFLAGWINRTSALRSLFKL